MDTRTQRWSGRWVIGGSLMAIGVLFLLMNMGLIDRFPLWKFWPVILIVLGINKILEPFHRAGGFWLLSIGVWFQVSFLGISGYGFRETWPAFLILLGIFWMWESIEKESQRRNIERESVGSVSDLNKI